MLEMPYTRNLEREADEVGLLLASKVRIHKSFAISSNVNNVLRLFRVSIEIGEVKNDVDRHRPKRGSV